MEDMKATPPGIGAEDKYFFGFCEGDELVAEKKQADVMAKKSDGKSEKQRRK
ncbi:MAG: hypothetical protein K6F51_02600 [Acetatifactor sp.]|nr:hypothetical protein [Acetatifactor sp.]